MKHSILFSGLEIKVWSARFLLAALALVSRSPGQAAVLPELLAYEVTVSNNPSPYLNLVNTVAIDGDTLVFSGGAANAAFVYVRHGRSSVNPTWDLQSVVGTPGLGYPVALSGNLLAVGAPGAVYVYERIGSSWVFRARVVASDSSGDSSPFGERLALNGDTLVVGSWNSFLNGTAIQYLEAAYVFVRQGNNWVQQQKLVASDRTNGKRFGCALAVDGDTIVVGADAMGGGDNIGAAYVFARNGTDWTQQQKLQSGEYSPADSFGDAVAVSGNTVAVGAHGHLSEGSAGGAIFVYVRTGGAWGQPKKLTLSSGTGPGTGLGWEVKLSGDLLVGLASGYLYAFARDGAEWGQPSLITDARFPYIDYVPNYIDLSGDTIVLGYARNMASGPVVTYAPNYANDSNVVAAVRPLLYFPEAVGPGTNLAAFRYKQLLYTHDGIGLRAQVEAMTNYFGAAERVRAAEAEDQVWRGLAFNTNSVPLGQLLLDLYYDRAVAESLLIREQMAAVETARFGPPLAAPAPTGRLLVDNEIPTCRRALDASRSVLKVYFGLFTNTVVVQTLAGAGPPDAAAGPRIFRDLVPGRGLEAATYLSNGVPVPVVTNTALFSGYKDLVLVFDMLRDYGRLTESLSRLLLGRNDPGDRAEAASMIGEARRFLFLQGNLLQNMFADLPPGVNASGLAEAIAGWSASLNRLDATEPVLAGGENPLGFAPDFLMLVEKFQGSNTTVHNSFDSLKERLNLIRTDSPLRRAHDRLAQARTAYGQYRGYQDQLAAQMEDTAQALEDRLFQIVGARPGDSNYSDNPTNNPGSELDQQYHSADAARLQIQKDEVEMNNLNEQVQIELDLIAATNAVNINYGKWKVPWQKQLDLVNGVESVFTDVADWASITLAKDPSVTINLAKVGGSIMKWSLSGATNDLGRGLAQLAADQQAQIEGLQTAARTKTVLLGLRTLTVAAQSAAVTLQQELNRLAALYREKADLEARLAESSQNLASRYFADPVHRLAAEATQVQANLAFDEAQRWLFFAARAFEYKWNITFTNWVDSGHTWSLSSLFALRNADELEDFYNALVDYDAIINRTPDDAYDWFSVREDFMGLKPLDDQGQPASYLDPVTGRALDAVSLFRTNLLRSVESVSGGTEIVLRFNTVRQIPGGTFFVGPTFGLEGNVISPGRFLDKIGWVRIQLLGPTNRSQLAGTLTYGGSSFVRNINPGHLAPGRPDQLVNEMTGYSTRYWFFDPVQQQWNSTEGMTLSGVPMEVMPDPDIPPSVSQIEELKERSVAATGWILRIPLVSQGVPVLSIDQLKDVRLYIYHYSVSRH